jgi:hemerythrin-like domain-containing protein
MDAIELLKADHEKVRDLLTQLTETTSRAEKKRTELLEKIRLELEVHTTIEEEIFYPAFREAGKKDEEEMYFEAVEEHRAAGELVLPDVLKTEVSSDQFAGRAKVLKELVEHHASEEEEEMFPKARKLLGKEQLQQLGEQMQQRKQELLDGGLPLMQQLKQQKPSAQRPHSLQ